MTPPTFTAVLELLLESEFGATIAIGSVSVTRGNFGGHWYVTNRSGYRCESQGYVDTAVYISALLSTYGERSLVLEAAV